MKKIFKITAFFCLLAAAMVSCVEVNLAEGRNDQVNGLLNVTIQIPGSPIEYTAEKKGPYEEGEEIIIKLPSDEDNPTDVTKLKMIVSLEHNCYVTDPIGKYIDFTEPYQIEVKDALGNLHHHYIKIVLLPPKTRFEFLWSKSNKELGIESRNQTGVALANGKLAIQEYDGKFYTFDYKGTPLKTLSSARSYMFKVDSDDAGHFVAARENAYGAGFMVYLFDDEKEDWTLILDYEAKNDDCLEDLGYEFSVCGDVTKGKAFIYGIAPTSMNIYSWELNDGQLVTPADTPNILRYGPAKKQWKRAQIQRASLDDNSEHFVSFLHMGEKEDDGQGSRFHIFSPSMDVRELNPKNTLYKILDFKVFTIGKDQYLVTSEQNFTAWSQSLVRVYDITNRSNMDMHPDSEGYNKFKIFESESIYPTNYNTWGDVDYTIEETETGYDVYIVSAVVGYDENESNVRMFKMTYNRQ